MQNLKDKRNDTGTLHVLAMQTCYKTSLETLKWLLFTAHIHGIQTCWAIVCRSEMVTDTLLLY